MVSFEPAIAITLRWEGGLSDNPNDPGGLTNFGISQRSYPTLDIRNLTQAEAEAIYRRDFWKYDGVESQAVANKLFDEGVNTGVSHAVKMAQSLLNISRDGVFGSGTLSALNSADAETFLQAYRQALVQFYTNLAQERPSEAGDLAGWLRRANS